MSTPSTTTRTSLRVALLLTASNGVLDVYTFLTRGVFATAQTGNVVIGLASVVNPKLGPALPHLWPILAFTAGIVLASMLRNEEVERPRRWPVRVALLLQTAILVAVASWPVTAPDIVVVIPLALGAGVQIGLFRQVRSGNYVAIATTGNLLRLTEATMTAVRTRLRSDTDLAWLYLWIFTAFVSGAVIGAFMTGWWGVHACWAIVVMVGLALAAFFIDDLRQGSRTMGTRLRSCRQ